MNRSPRPPRALRERVRHFVHRSGHHVYRITLGFGVVGMVAPLLPLPDRVVALTLVLALATTVFAIVFGLSAHRARLCDACLSEMPLNGQELAARWRRSLRLIHFLADNRKRLLVVLVTWQVSNLVVTRILPSVIANVLVYGPGLIIVATMMRHQRVQPWCKQCGWDDGGGGRIEMPTPDPGTHRRA